jgi:glycerol-1-phosphate dehydrogenase [NAD(P)+]
MKIKLEDFKAPCSCNRTHPIEVEEVHIGAGVVEQIAPFLFQKRYQKKGLNRILIICDTNTLSSAQKVREVIEAFKQQNVVSLKEKGNDQCIQVCELLAKDLYADEKGLCQIEKYIGSKVKEDPEILVAVGAGTIHDLTRYIAKEHKVPFISVPTAASVDGFVSTVCAMTFKGFKVTTPGVAPIAVFADTHIFSKAPKRLTASGVGDLLGKYTALADWKISHLLTGEYLCEQVVNLEEEALCSVVKAIPRLAKGEKEAYESLMYGLLLSGLAMQMVGNSRPASGAEHHLSHLWEMHVINEELDALHGEKVGVGLVLVCEKYKEVLNKLEESSLLPYSGFPHFKLKEVFKNLYDEIEKENRVDCLSEISNECFKTHAGQIKQILRELPERQEIEKLLTMVDGKITLEDIELHKEMREESLFLSPYVRNRLTLMRVSQRL